MELFVFEAGLELRRATDGRWVCTTAQSDSPVPEIVPEEVLDRLGLRTVLRRDAWADEYMPSTLVLPSQETGGSLRAKLIRNPEDRRGIRAFAFELQYLMSAVEHHCVSLAESYALVCRMFARTATGFQYDQSVSRVNVMSQQEPYHEFDALVSAVRRLYNALRIPLWLAFGARRGTPPKNLENTVATLDNEPTEIIQQVRASCEKYGTRLKAYRDCQHHYVSTDFLMASAEMHRLDLGPWTVRMRIPDNPEARSRRGFTFNKNLDALGFGWECAGDVLPLTVATVHACQAAAIAADGDSSITRPITGI